MVELAVGAAGPAADMSRAGIVALLLCLGASPLAAGTGDILGEEDIQQIIDKAVAGYWGQAQLPGGQVIYPDTDEEMLQPVIPDADARRIVRDAVPAALGLWCGLDWETYYASYVERERKGAWNEKQMAFVEVLFGTTLGSVRVLLEEDCDEETRSLVRDTLTSGVNALSAPDE